MTSHWVSFGETQSPDAGWIGVGGEPGRVQFPPLPPQAWTQPVALVCGDQVGVTRGCFRVSEHMGGTPEGLWGPAERSPKTSMCLMLQMLLVQYGILFRLLSRLVIAFLPMSKCLLISRLQSPSAVILEPKKMKSATVSIVSPSICHEVN